MIPQGTVRAALAEAASLELAGAFGLMTKSQKPTAVRCAVASFGAHEGVVSARTVVFDTDKALITMTGEAQIDTEALDFTLRGHPKRQRWRCTRRWRCAAHSPTRSSGLPATMQPARPVWPRRWG